MSPYALGLELTLLLAFWLTLAVWQKDPQTPGRLHFVLLAGAAGVWCFATECPASLTDLLEHRVRMALWAAGQGLPELPLIARVAAEAAGWNTERARAEADAYAASVRRRYQIVVSHAERSAA